MGGASRGERTERREGLRAGPLRRCATDGVACTWEASRLWGTLRPLLAWTCGRSSSAHGRRLGSADGSRGPCAREGHGPSPYRTPVGLLQVGGRGPSSQHSDEGIRANPFPGGSLEDQFVRLGRLSASVQVGTTGWGTGLPLARSLAAQLAKPCEIRGRGRGVSPRPIPEPGEGERARRESGKSGKICVSGRAGCPCARTAHAPCNRRSGWGTGRGTVGAGW